MRAQLGSTKSKSPNRAVPPFGAVQASPPDFNQYNELRARVDQLHSLMSEVRPSENTCFCFRESEQIVCAGIY